jgi:hypothetical protein
MSEQERADVKRDDEERCSSLLGLERKTPALPALALLLERRDGVVQRLELLCLAVTAATSGERVAQTLGSDRVARRRDLGLGERKGGFAVAFGRSRRSFGDGRRCARSGSGSGSTTLASRESLDGLAAGARRR